LQTVPHENSDRPLPHTCRTHKLFIITSGGCSNLSDKFYNCFVDIRGSNMTAEDVLESEEAYYLKRINGRNNTRILKMVADEMGLSIPSVVDSCAYDPYEVAVCTTETMVNDMHRQKDGRISVLVKCVDTTRIENGSLCSMNPAEGFWLFKGSNRHNSSMNQYGGPFGDEARQTSLPSCMSRIHHNYSWCSKPVKGSAFCDRSSACMVWNRASSNIARLDRTGQVVSCGASPMEMAVMSRGGRLPDHCVAPAASAGAQGPPLLQGGGAGGGSGANGAAEAGPDSSLRRTTLPIMEPLHPDMADEASTLVGRHNIISASYIAAHNFKQQQMRLMSSSQHQQNTGGGGGAAGAMNGKAANMFGTSSMCGTSMLSGRGGSMYFNGKDMLPSAAEAAAGADSRYTYMDEEYMRRMHADMGWDRDNGMIHLMPIAVVYQEDLC
jgi:hypothetical protein